MTDTILSAYAANWIETLQSPMMVNAFLAGILIALASGAISPFPASPLLPPMLWHISDCPVQPWQH